MRKGFLEEFHVSVCTIGIQKFETANSSRMLVSRYGMRVENQVVPQAKNYTDVVRYVIRPLMQANSSG